MRIPRIYQSAPLLIGHELNLSDDAANHIGRVLRMKVNDKLELFDGTNTQFSAVITAINKKNVSVFIESATPCDRESPLHLHLGQVISRGEKMEFTIQKSTELGVNIITPLLSNRCGVRLDQERLEKKRSQWQKIAISACEQCGRNQIPEIRPVMQLADWRIEMDDCLKLNLHPYASQRISTLKPTVKRIRLLIGPEGGLTDDEIALTAINGFTDILLGPRVLRTETAALTAITALQTQFGDLG